MTMMIRSRMQNADCHHDEDQSGVVTTLDDCDVFVVDTDDFCLLVFIDLMDDLLLGHNFIDDINCGLIYLHDWDVWYENTFLGILGCLLVRNYNWIKAWS